MNFPRIARSSGPLFTCALVLSACGGGMEVYDRTYRAEARARVETAVAALRGTSEAYMRSELGRPYEGTRATGGGGPRQVVWRRGHGQHWCEVKATFDGTGRVTDVVWRDVGMVGGLRECDKWLGGNAAG